MNRMESTDVLKKSVPLLICATPYHQNILKLSVFLLDQLVTKPGRFTLPFQSTSIGIAAASRGHIANAGLAIVAPTVTPQVNRQRTVSPLKCDFKHDINIFVSDPIMNSSSNFHTEFWD